MQHLHRLFGTLLLTLLFTTAGSLHAQPPGFQLGWQTDLGLGVIVNPEYQGAEDYRVLPVPYFDVRYVDERGVKTFINVPQGIGTYLVRERTDSGNRFAVSAAVGPGFQNRDTDAFLGLETFGIGIEGRLGVEYDVGSWSLRGQVAQAIASGHEGLYADFSAGYRFAVSGLGRGAFASVGPALRFGNSSYMSALYGVTARESLASGLRAFDAGSGLESAAVQGVLSFPVGEKWRFTGVARMAELLGDAGGSSLTAQSTQFFIVTALTRRL